MSTRLFILCQFCSIKGHYRQYCLKKPDFWNAVSCLKSVQSIKTWYFLFNYAFFQLLIKITIHFFIFMDLIFFWTWPHCAQFACEYLIFHVLCFSLLLPLSTLATGNDEFPWLVILMRALMGVCEGATFPSVSAMMAKWAPQSERSRMSTFIYAGRFWRKIPIPNLFATLLSERWLYKKRWIMAHYCLKISSLHSVLLYCSL